jgi:SAM-dependent methyltransferase
MNLQQPIVYAWLENLYRHANKPDENLGAHSVGRAICRMTGASAKALMERFQEYAPHPEAFVDLGCGRGLVCATAVAMGVKNVFGWDLNALEIEWAQKNVVPALGVLRNIVPGGDAFNFQLEEGNALDFCLERDVTPGPVWVLAFWLDWGYSERMAIGRRLLLDGNVKVFACTDIDLLRKLSYSYHHGYPSYLFEETMYERLTESYKCAGSLSITLSGSREHHTLYFYVNVCYFSQA